MGRHKKAQLQESELPTVCEVPPACPHCESPRRSFYGLYRLPDRPMKLPTGEMHMGIVIRYAACDDCGLKYRVKAPLL